MNKNKSESVTPGYFGKGKRLYSVKEAAEYLGIAVQTLYNMRHRRQGPDYVMIGGVPKYEEAAIERFIESNRVCLSA
ncbi:helix-turn-helix domain-containing protein [Desulfobacter curvatus]|uniref:helix-turn-helix domain-containing protein n=1 Tax=Desulfobacter curvatus TaxID=2290 RepID=UPI0003633EFF|nr:helix-turn-helix domain-containing protein [Desulfobacter curvatus]